MSSQAENENDTKEYVDCLSSLKKVNNGINRQEVILWFNENDVDYHNMSDLDMYIYYIEKNSFKMGNNLTSTLPPSIDSTLMDIAQMFGNISYGDIIKYGNKADKKSIGKMRYLVRKLKDEGAEEQSTIDKIVQLVKSL